MGLSPNTPEGVFLLSNLSILFPLKLKKSSFGDSAITEFATTIQETRN